MTRPWIFACCLFASSLFVIGCGDDDDMVIDSGTDAADAADSAMDTSVDTTPPDTNPPDTGPPPPDGGPPCNGPPGLYLDNSCILLAEGVRYYEPRYALWSDAAEKERYIKLPEGTTIDTTDADGWVFPQGTTLWKTFSRDGVRLETRIMTKIGDGVGVAMWTQQTYLWNEAQDAVLEITEGAEDVLGTTHDVPATALCVRCHSGSAGGSQDLVLGFGAIQLNHVNDGITLRDLLMEETLTTAIDPADATVPTDDPVTREALGFMHSNCGPCHGGAAAPLGMRLWIDVGVALEEQEAIITTVGEPGIFTTGGVSTRITAGDPDTSTVVLRMQSRTAPDQMPPLASEDVDDTGVEAVRAWIESLPVAKEP